MTCAGIDVGSRKLVLVIQKEGKAGKAEFFSNDESGHRQLLQSLLKAKVQRVGLEATGSYHLDLALRLADCPELQVMVINPRAAKHFGEAVGCRTKTDPVDAKLLANYVERMAFSPWQRPRDEVLALRAGARRLASLAKQLTVAKNQLHAWKTMESTPDFVVEDAVLTVRQFESQISRLREHCLRLVKSDPWLNESLELLVTTTGVARASGLRILGEVLILPEDMTQRQWVAMAGLDPRHHSSGSSVNKKPRLSKAGNAYLREALYMPALSAVRHDPHVRAYYRHLIDDNGLKGIQAVCAVMRKFLHAFHAILKHRQPFDNNRFYAIPGAVK
jgi:transposase